MNRKMRKKVDFSRMSLMAESMEGVMFLEVACELALSSETSAEAALALEEVVVQLKEEASKGVASKALLSKLRVEKWLSKAEALSKALVLVTLAVPKVVVKASLRALKGCKEASLEPSVASPGAGCFELKASSKALERVENTFLSSVLASLSLIEAVVAVAVVAAVAGMSST